MPGPSTEESEQWNVTIDGETAQRLRERYPVARDDSEAARMAFQEVLSEEPDLEVSIAELADE